MQKTCDVAGKAILAKNNVHAEHWGRNPKKKFFGSAKCKGQEHFFFTFPGLREGRGL